MNNKKHRKTINVDAFLMWVYQEQCAHRNADPGVGLSELERRAAGLSVQENSSSARLMELARLGARVDSFGQAIPKIHPDAEFAHDQITGGHFTKWEAARLVAFGCSGIVPDPMLGVVPKAMPDRKPNGKIKMLHKGKKRQPYVCLVKFENSIEDIEFARREYAVWHDALSKFYARMVDLDTMLTSYNLRSLKAHRRPWETEKIA